MSPFTARYPARIVLAAVFVATLLNHALAVAAGLTISIGASSTLVSVMRTDCTPNPSGKVQPVSSYGFSVSLGAQY